MRQQGYAVCCVYGWLDECLRLNWLLICLQLLSWTCQLGCYDLSPWHEEHVSWLKQGLSFLCFPLFSFFYFVTFMVHWKFCLMIHVWADLHDQNRSVVEKTVAEWASPKLKWALIWDNQETNSCPKGFNEEIQSKLFFFLKWRCFAERGNECDDNFHN